MASEIKFESVLDEEPPNNGRVTQAMLYRALHRLDEGLTRRFTTLLDAINNSSDESQQLRADLEKHRNDHPGQSAAKQTGKLALLVAFFTALATVAQRILN